MDPTPPLVPPPVRDPAALEYAAWEAPARRYRPDASPALEVRFTRLAGADPFGDAPGVDPGGFDAAGGDADDVGAAVAELVGPDGTLHPLAQFLGFEDADALEWGYMGGGPAVTSAHVLALLLPPKEAWRLRQAFKADVIGLLPRWGGTVRLAEVRGWIEAKWAAERADPGLMAREAARSARRPS